MLSTPDHAILLAAGAATRLRPLTAETPKCLLDVGRVPILRRALGHLHATGTRQLALVTGFQAQKIQAAVAAWQSDWPGLEVTWIHNADWATTNNSVSLLLAREAVAGRPFVLLDSDIVFERPVLERLLASPHADALALREGPVGAEEIKVEIEPSGRVRRIGKAFAPELAAGESIGIEKFSPAGGAAMFTHLSRRVRDLGLVNEWYEASWQDWFDAGGQMYAVGVGDAYCAEIDSHEDFATVGREIAAREATSASG